MSRIKAMALSLIPRWLRGGGKEQTRVAPELGTLPAELRVDATPITPHIIPESMSSTVDFRTFPNDFKAVVAQKKLLSRFLQMI